MQNNFGYFGDLVDRRERTRIRTLDHDLDCALDVFNRMDDGTCWKLTVTFNRKYWKKTRAFRHSYVALQHCLNAADVSEGLFFMELHDSGWPHIHGFIKWKSQFSESSEYLRSILVGRFGQTKLFKYKPEEFKEMKKSKRNKGFSDDVDFSDLLEYDTWFDYISKEYGSMMTFKREVAEQFPVTCYYFVEDDDCEIESVF